MQQSAAHRIAIFHQCSIFCSTPFHPSIVLSSFPNVLALLVFYSKNEETTLPGRNNLKQDEKKDETKIQEQEQDMQLGPVLFGHQRPRTFCFDQSHQ
jgi:hypothetical protein